MNEPQPEESQPTTPSAPAGPAPSLVDQWLGKPWWGYSCICFGFVSILLPVGLRFRSRQQQKSNNGLKLR